MENQILKTGNKKPTRRNNKQIVPTTETGNPIMFVTIEEHQKILDNKNSENIALNNALNASEKIIKNLDRKITELSNDNRSIRFNVTCLNNQVDNLKSNLDKIPKWIKYLFNVK